MEESDEEGGERGPSFDGVATGVEFKTGTEFKRTSDMLDKLVVEQEVAPADDESLRAPDSINVVTGGRGHELLRVDILGNGAIQLDDVNDDDDEDVNVADAMSH